MSIRASIDLGTNTCLLLVVEWDEVARAIRNVISDHATIVRLGQGVDRDRKLHPDAMRRTRQCLIDYAAIIRAAGGDPARTVAVATSQARDSANAAEFLDGIQKDTGIRFRLLSGDEEANYTFTGALLPDVDPARAAVIDIGGGSTEITALNQSGKSLDVGSVRYTERYLKSNPVSDPEFWACQEAIDAEIELLKSWRKSLPLETQLLAVAGTATTLAAWQLGLGKFDAAPIDKLTLSRGDVHRLVEELKWRTVEERQQLPGIEPGRADVLLAGALILWRAMELLEFSETRISTRGLRYGVIGLN